MAVKETLHYILTKIFRVLQSHLLTYTWPVCGSCTKACVGVGRWSTGFEWDLSSTQYILVSQSLLWRATVSTQEQDIYAIVFSLWGSVSVFSGVQHYLFYLIAQYWFISSLLFLKNIITPLFLCPSQQGESGGAGRVA